MMKATTSTTDILLAARFKYAGRRLFFARARLYRDHIALTGWEGLERHRRVIALEDIKEVRWRPGDGSTYNVTLVLSDGERLPLWLDGAGLWKYAIAQARGQEAAVRNGALPGEMTPASAA